MGEVPSFLRPLEWVAEKISDSMDTVYAGPTPKPEVDLHLPYLISQELRFSETGDVSKRAVEQLLHEGWYDQSVYLVLKMLDNNPQKQRQLLERLCQAEQSGEDVDQVKTVLFDALLEMPQEATVQAGKLAQISRQGNYNWADQFLGKVRAYSAEEKDPFLVAYASLQGLRYFTRVVQKKGGTVHILIPNWIHSKESDSCGYTVSFSGGVPTVSFLPKTFERPSNAIVFDETKNTGNAIKQIEQFWAHGGAFAIPQTDCIVHVQGDHKKARHTEY